MSIAQSQKIASIKLTFFHFFLFLFLRFSLTKKGAKLLMISKNTSHKSLTIKDLQLRGGGPEALSPWCSVGYDLKNLN